MKKFTVLFGIALMLLVGFSVESYSQGTIVEDITLPADTLYGDADASTVYAPLLDEYWDYSIQFVSTFLSGDSSYWSVKTYQTNDPAQSGWTELTTLRDTLVTATDNDALIIEKSDFSGLWMKHVLLNYTTGDGGDTVIVTPYVVRKQKRNRFF